MSDILRQNCGKQAIIHAAVIAATEHAEALARRTWIMPAVTALDEVVQ